MDGWSIMIVIMIVLYVLALQTRPIGSVRPSFLPAPGLKGLIKGGPYNKIIQATDFRLF